MRVHSGIAALACLLLAAGCTFADPVGAFNEIVAFGDSLSDSGNASLLTAGTEPGLRGPGYYYRSVPGVPVQLGEFTNAPTSPSGPTGVWVDQLASKLNVPLAQPSLAGGTNYAVATAVTGSSGAPNIDTEVAEFSLATLGKAPSNALYTIWGGANDVLDITNPNPTTAQVTGVMAADNLSKNILTLSSEGARYFLWANLPDLGKTPFALAAGAGPAGIATLASDAFNAEWAIDLMQLQADGISVVGMDVASLFAANLADPAKFGFTNVTASAITVPGANPDNYLFWDDVHPTAAEHAVVADLAYADLLAAPEPAAVGLAGLGLAALLLTASRARRKRQPRY